MLLVPLPSTSSRGEQSLNAQSFKRQGFAEILEDGEISAKLCEKVDEVYQYRNDYIKNMTNAEWKRTSNKELFEIITDEQNI